MHTPEIAAQSFIVDHPKLRLCFAARDLADLAAALSAYGAACAAQERERCAVIVENTAGGHYMARVAAAAIRAIRDDAAPPVPPTAPTE